MVFGSLHDGKAHHSFTTRSRSHPSLSRLTHLLPSKPPQLRSTPHTNSSITHHSTTSCSFFPGQYTGPRPHLRHPFPASTPLPKYCRTSPTLLPVPHVPLLSQVCQLAITKSPETDPCSTFTTTNAPSRILYETAFAQYASQPPSLPPPLTDASNRVAAADPAPDVTAAANTSNHHHAHSSHVTKPQASQVSSGDKRVTGEICCGMCL